MNSDVLQYAQSNAALFAALIAFFSPLVIAFVQQPKWPYWARTVVTVLSSAAVGVGGAYFSGQFQAKTAVSGVLLALVVTTMAYEHVFKSAARRIELKTSGVQLGFMGSNAPAFTKETDKDKEDETMSGSSAPLGD